MSEVRKNRAAGSNLSFEPTRSRLGTFNCVDLAVCGAVLPSDQFRNAGGPYIEKLATTPTVGGSRAAQWRYKPAVERFDISPGAAKSASPAHRGELRMSALIKQTQ